jgi:hypothetical protein
MGWGRTYWIAITLALGLTHAWAQTSARIGTSIVPHKSLGPKGVLTHERQVVLATALATHGHNFPMPHEIAAALGIPYSEAENMRQLTFKGGGFGYHVYAPLSEGGFLVAFSDETAVRTYRFDRRTKLVAAISEVPKRPISISLFNAKGPAAVETKNWADMADQLQDGR